MRANSLPNVERKGNYKLGSSLYHTMNDYIDIELVNRYWTAPLTLSDSRKEWIQFHSNVLSMF